MVTVLVIVVLVGLGVALFEILSSRRSRQADTRAQLDALSRVVEPQQRREERDIDRPHVTREIDGDAGPED